jgi:hypothetical protein
MPSEEVGRVEVGLSLEAIRDALGVQLGRPVARPGERIYANHRTSQHLVGLAIDVHVSELVPDGEVLIMRIPPSFGERMEELGQALREVGREIERQFRPALERMEAILAESDQVDVLGERDGFSYIDTLPVAAVDLAACWRCDAKIAPEDEVGLCEPCKTQLRDL